MASDLQEHPDGDAVAAPVLPVYGPDGTCLTDYGPDRVVAAGRAPRTSEQRQVEAIRSCPPGPELDAWLRGLDSTVLSSAIVVEAIAAQDRMESHHHARKLALVAELASREEMRPDWSPLAGAPPTQRCVAADELRARLGWSQLTATKTVYRALFLDGMLASTREALETGHVDAAKADVLATLLRDLPYQAAHAVEDAVLPDAGRCSVSQFRQRVEREVRLVDPDGEARRHQRERRTRKVSHPRARAHGMASMWLVLAAEDAARVDGVLNHAARAAKALGDDRTLDQLRADGLRDLVVGDVPPSDGPAFEVELTEPEPGSLPQPRPPSDGPWVSDRDGPVLPRPAEPIPTATLVPLNEAAEHDAAEPAAAQHDTVEHAAADPGGGPPQTPAVPGAAPVTEAGSRPPSPGAVRRAPGAVPPAAAPGEPSPAPAPPTASRPTRSPGPDPAPHDTAPSAPSAPPAPRTAATTQATALSTAPRSSAASTAQRGCRRCSGRPGAEVRITVRASTLLGLDDQPADLEGHGPIDAVRARALAAGGVWRRVVTDPMTDRVLDVGRERYRPPAALDEFVRTRDETCAFPGCTVPACRCELDHTVAYRPRPGADPGEPLGRTDADNLGPVCHRHHRLKTDGGFRLRQIEPGLFEWITPAGHRYLTRPGTGQSHDATADPHDEPPPF
jgi:hypothetical protein